MECVYSRVFCFALQVRIIYALYVIGFFSAYSLYYNRLSCKTTPVFLKQCITPTSMDKDVFGEGVAENSLLWWIERGCWDFISRLSFGWIIEYWVPHPVVYDCGLILAVTHHGIRAAHYLPASGSLVAAGTREINSVRLVAAQYKKQVAFCDWILLLYVGQKEGSQGG